MKVVYGAMVERCVLVDGKGAARNVKRGPSVESVGEGWVEGEGRFLLVGGRVG